MTWATMSKGGAIRVRAGVPNLEQLQDAVGGWIEPAEIRDDGLTMWVNEEGKVRFLAGEQPRSQIENHVGTALMDAAGWFDGDWCAGDVAFTGGSDDNGDQTSLAEEQLDYLAGFAALEAA